MKKFLLLFFLSVFLAACTSSRAFLSDADLAKSLNGVWGGLLPCADCPGIELRLTLNDNGTYNEIRTYRDRDVSPRHLSGAWEILPANIIKLKSEQGITDFLKYDRGILQLSDEKGKKLNKDRRAVLTREDRRIIDSWGLVSLNGKRIDLADFHDAYPGLEFIPDSWMVRGNTSCNSLKGNFMLLGNSLLLSELVSTKKACGRQDFETAFLSALSETLIYEVQAGKLILSKGNKSIMEFSKLE